MELVVVTPVSAIALLATLEFCVILAVRTVRMVEHWSTLLLHVNVLAQLHMEGWTVQVSINFY